MPVEEQISVCEYVCVCGACKLLDNTRCKCYQYRLHRLENEVPQQYANVCRYLKTFIEIIRDF